MQPSDYKNKILVGDAVKVMQQLPDGSIDLIVTRPHTTSRTEQEMDTKVNQF